MSNPFGIKFDTSEISAFISNEEIMDFVIDEIDETMTDILTDIISPPSSGGVPVDTGEARNSVQLDRSDPLNQEIYSTADYMQALEDGHSKQSSHMFQRAIDKHTD